MDWQFGYLNSSSQWLMFLTDLKWTELEVLDRNIPVVIPVAALEQHGHHLPLFTDSMLMSEVLKRALDSCGSRCIVAPLLWLGNSEHHLDFPGTLSAAPRVYLDLIGGLAENFIMHGFKRIVFLNGHGGNDVPGKQALFEVRQRYRNRSDLLLLFATYWHLAPNAHQCHPDLIQHEMGHACEWETSMILRIAPALVGDYHQARGVPFGDAFNPAFRAWITKDRTVPGHIGEPASASVEKGESLLSCFAEACSRCLHRVAQWDGKSWEG